MKCMITRYVLVLATIIIFNSCVIEDEPYNDTFKIIAHRGYHIIDLGNTEESFDAAYEKNYKNIEFDVCFSSDNQAVIIHDYKLDDQSDTKGFIYDIPIADIMNINLAGGYKIQSLDSAFLKFSNSFESMFIDVKQPCSDSALINFAALVKKYNLYHKLIITGPYQEIISRLRTIDANLPLGIEGEFESTLQLCVEENYKYLLISFSELDEKLCFLASKNNIKVYVFTPNTRSEIINCIKYNIDGAMSDNVDLMRQILN